MLTSIGGSRFAEAVAVAMLERGTYRKYLERLRRRMRDALGSTVQALEASGWEVFETPLGGKFVWARVPHVERLRRGSSNAAHRLASRSRPAAISGRTPKSARGSASTRRTPAIRVHRRSSMRRRLAP